MAATQKAPQSIRRQVLARLRRLGPGGVVASRDLRDLGDAAAVRQALSRGVRDGELQRAARGLYALPREDPKLGPLSTSAEAVVAAVQRRDGIRLLPSGAHAANVLGISEQVPVKLVFLTDGPTRRIQVGKREIVLKRTTPRQMATAGRTSGTVIQALRWMGRENVDEQVVATLRRNLSARERRQLLKDVRYAPHWVAQVLRQIAEPGGART